MLLRGQLVDNLRKGSVPCSIRYFPMSRLTSVLTGRQSCIRSTESAVKSPVLHQIGQEQVRVCRFLPLTRLLATARIRLHTPRTVKFRRSQRRAYRLTGGLSTKDARFNLKWRTARCNGVGRVREWCFPPITA